LGQHNHDNQRIIPTFKSLVRTAGYLCFQKRKEQLLHIMTTYDVRLSFCFHLKFDTLSFQITFETGIGANVILDAAFNDAQMMELVSKTNSQE